jgi:hypothetical protein
MTTLAALSLGLWHGADKGRGASLLTCGDVESNPGPGARPGRSAGSFEHVLVRHLKQLGLLELLELEQIPPPDEGPCAAPGQQGISSSGWMVAYCLCGATLYLRSPDPVLAHVDACHMARYLRKKRWDARNEGPFHNTDATGQGVRDVDADHSDESTATERSRREGRGASLLSCGDVEAKPGPGPGDPPAPVEDPAGMQLDAAGMLMLMSLVDVLQQPPCLQLAPAPGPQNGPLTWASLSIPPDRALVPEPHNVRPQRTGGRRRRLPESAPADLVHVPAPQGVGPTVLDSDVDLAHAAHSGPPVEPVDGAGNCLRAAEVRARPLGALQLPNPLPFLDLLCSRQQPIHHLPASLQADFTGVLAASLNRYCTTPTEGKLFALLALPKLTMRPQKSRAVSPTNTS